MCVGVCGVEYVIVLGGYVLWGCVDLYLGFLFGVYWGFGFCLGGWGGIFLGGWVFCFGCGFWVVVFVVNFELWEVVGVGVEGGEYGV